MLVANAHNDFSDVLALWVAVGIDLMLTATVTFGLMTVVFNIAAFVVGSCIGWGSRECWCCTCTLPSLSAALLAPSPPPRPPPRPPPSPPPSWTIHIDQGRTGQKGIDVMMCVAMLVGVLMPPSIRRGAPQHMPQGIVFGHHSSRGQNGDVVRVHCGGA